MVDFSTKQKELHYSKPFPSVGKEQMPIKRGPQHLDRFARTDPGMGPARDEKPKEVESYVQVGSVGCGWFVRPAERVPKRFYHWPHVVRHDEEDVVRVHTLSAIWCSTHHSEYQGDTQEYRLHVLQTTTSTHAKVKMVSTPSKPPGEVSDKTQFSVANFAI